MKPFMRIGSFFLAVALVVVTAGCTPATLKAQWSYKTDKNELPIGVYIYSLYSAYSEAQSLAKDLDGYDEKTEAWLDLEITDDDDNKAVAREWIKNEAKKMCLTYLALDAKIAELGIDVGGATKDSADESAKEYWDLGPYASYGYIMPMKDTLEPYGVSFESFAYCTTEYNTKNSALFDATYGKGGSKEVTDKEFEEYFTTNYTDYKYFTVNLYESTTDEAGESKDVALSDSKIKSLKAELDKMAADISKGKSYDDVMAAYMKNNDLDETPETAKVENLEDSSLGDEVKEAIKKLNVNSAATLQVGEDANSAIYYFVYKADVKNDINDYVYDESQRSTLLSNMKQDEFDDYLDSLAKEVENSVSINQKTVDRFKPELFFVKPESSEETTEASDEE